MLQSQEIVPKKTKGKSAVTKQKAISEIQDYDLIYSKVKRGEVYICDFGTPYGSEQGKKRYAIVVQNNDGNQYSPTTIVLACTTKRKDKSPVHYNFTFSKNNMLDYNKQRVGTKKNTVMAEQIRTVDKRRLRKYIGIMNQDFMEKIQEIIDISLQLRRNKNT